MKVNVVTIYNKKYAPVFKETFESHIDYCTEHEFNYYPFYSKEEDGDKVKLEKFNIIYRACTKDTDFVLYIDSDVLIVKPEHNLFSILEEGKQIYLSEDQRGINTGFMLLKNTPYVHGVLASLINLGPHTPKEREYFDETCRADQELIKLYYNSFESFREKTLMIDQSIVANPFSNEISIKSAFAKHFFADWKGVEDVEKRIIKKKL